MSTRLWGCHVSASGGLENALKNAKTLGVNTIQIHASPPQRWNSKPFAPGAEAKYLELLPSSGVKKVFFHGVYLINLATPDKQMFHLSKLSLVHYLDLMERIGGDGVIFHVGSLKDQPDEKAGFGRAAEGVNWILEHADNKAKLLLEVAAGSGTIVGDRMEELAAIYEMVEDKKRVGFALDTQHLWASGYDLIGELDQFADDAARILGLDKIWAIHLNDSKTEFASRKDRHENIGDGLIGREGIKRFLRQPKLAKIPFVLETPALKDITTAAEEVKKVRQMLEER